MKNLWIISILSLAMSSCIDNKSSEAESSETEIVSTSNELKNPPRVESPAELNLREGQEFLAENAKKEGVVTLESGLQYKVLIPGTGAIPNEANEVNVHYHGTLLNGTVFDSSVERGKPISFPVTGVIPGWIEALQLMKTGAKWVLYIPSDLAYGAYGSGQEIGPNSTLIFEVELLGIK